MKTTKSVVVRSLNRIGPWIAAGAIALMMAWITLGHTGSARAGQRFQFLPFVGKIDSFLCLFTHCVSRRHWLRNFLVDSVGNVVIFIPYGAAVFIALRNHSRPLRKAVLLGLALSLTFEIVQIWIPGRVIATDDLLLNTLGAAIGAWLSSGILTIYRASAPPADGAGRSPYPPANRDDPSRP
jgi:glycopeptide antibiotics resistance protein